jgi:hypothetical protein
MRRREFITFLSSAAAWPFTAHAQQPERMRRIGVLMGFAESDREGQAFVAAFREGLQKLGWAEGRNIRIDYRWTGLDTELVQRFAKELVALQPDLILTQSTPATAELLRQSRIIPIVFALVADPIGSGFVASFPQPGGNVTGFVTIEPTMASKWLELLKEIAPRVARAAMLFNPATAPYAEYWLNPFKAAATSVAVQAIVAPVHDTSELESVVPACWPKRRIPTRRAPKGPIPNIYGPEYMKEWGRDKTPTRLSKMAWSLVSCEQQDALSGPKTMSAFLSLLAQSRHPDRVGECPLSGVKRTSKFKSVTSAFDPFETWATKDSRRKACSSRFAKRDIVLSIGWV